MGKPSIRLTFLGTGTSCGVPVIGCPCRVCHSDDPKDKRLRCSALVETARTRLLIDCGPDFRQQMLYQPFRKIDALLITHPHYDHVGGIDDIRPFCHFGDIDIYGNRVTLATLVHNMPYCFAETKYPGVPQLSLHTIEPHQQIDIGDFHIVAVEVMHGNMPILGYRIGSLAYITDMKTIAPAETDYLKGVDTLVVNALRFTPEHHSHQCVDDAISFARQIGAKRTLLIHSCHHIGLHAEVNNQLPDDIQLAYDGQTLWL